MKPLPRPWMSALVLLCMPAALRAAEQAVADPVGYPGFPIGQVVPKPSKVHYTGEHVTLWDGAAKACVVVPRAAHAALKLAARELAARPGTIASLLWPGIAGALPSLPIVADLDAAKQFPAAIVLGAPDGALMKRLGAEGYLVTWRRAGAQRIVECRAAGHRGAYYGAQSLQQLMDSQQHRITLRVAEIEDRPLFGIRASGNDGSIPRGEGICERAVEWLPHFKLNGWAVGQSYIWPDNWRQTPRDRLDPLKRACTKARETDVIDVIFQIHPFRGRPHDKQFNMVISDPKDLEAFIGLCDEMLSAGAKGINFRADDYHPLSPQDQARFGSKAAAHIHLVNEMHKRLKARHPDYTLIFCPPFYTNGVALRSPENSAYLRKLGPALPPDVHIMWTGPVTRSLEITHEHIAVFKGLIGRDPFLWDNTVYAHRGRYGYSTRHPGYVFDTFQTQYPGDYGTTCPGIRYNWGYGDRVTTKVGNVNIADYMWNPAGYQPEASLRQALAIVGGKGVVGDLLAFREAYYEIKDAQDAGKVGELDVFGRMQKAARELPAIHERISAKSTSRRLAADLAPLRTRALAVFGQAKASVGQMLAARKTMLAEFDFSQPPWQPAVNGKWTVTRERTSASFSFPMATRSFAGAFGRVVAKLDVPTSPTGSHYLVFSAYDSYTGAGTPRAAWPGYLCKQVLVDDMVVWEDDVEGREPPGQQALQIVDVTGRLRGRKSVQVAFQGFDKRGVGNMSSTIRFANASLIAGPCSLLASCAEVPDCPPLRPTRAFTIAMSFTPRKLGTRLPLYAKRLPFQYFGFVHESGHVIAGVFVGGAEHGITTSKKAVPSQRNTFAFVFDQANVKLFLNGSLEAERRIEGDVDQGSGQLTIGAYSSDATYFDGTIHDVKLFSRALDSGELAAQHAAATPSRARAADITANASCEALDAHGRPVAWTCRAARGNAQWGASDQAHSGNRSVFLRAQPGAGEATLVHGPTEPQAGVPGYPASPKTVYRFSLWAKGDVGRIAIEPQGYPSNARGASPHGLGQFPVWLGPEWKRFDGTFMTREDTKRFTLTLRVPPAQSQVAGPALHVDDLTIQQLPPGLVGWWKLDAAHAVAARDLAGACPDGALYRRWRVGQ